MDFRNSSSIVLQICDIYVHLHEIQTYGKLYIVLLYVY